MKLSTKGRYAMVALADLALQPGDQLVSLGEISKRQDISLPYLEQLFAKLRRNGLVESIRGPGGGYRLSRQDHEINVAEIVDAVGDKIDVILDSGVQRGTHVLKALSLGAKAVGIGRGYLYPLAAAGQPGVERALGLMRAELERGMKLMGKTSVDQLSAENLRFR